jgi:hypothetical protein
MSSWKVSPEEGAPVAPPDLFAGEGGLPAPLASDRDPFELLDDLMATVEALCPRWPERELFGPMRLMRL